MAGSLSGLAGNVADMSRHVGDDTTCRSNFGPMGPCRRHKFFDVVAVCVGFCRHFPDFPKSMYNILRTFVPGPKHPLANKLFDIFGVTMASRL